ncbi:hypothetical protein [Nonomuraea soli]|uniref:Uncharacterized protein n=1 Tax=Nonomuraea soli TaxID=1032476 RepID=A0A7W0HUX0_9ACTN|nr:hypothetical protein [Nonomuraea soli]MBA2896634.1 hypothetical protein [Nonomuraea soli]
MDGLFPVILAVVITVLMTLEGIKATSRLSRRLMRSAARIQYGETERGAIRTEELEALIAHRPGNLFKLFTAVSFWGAAGVKGKSLRVRFYVETAIRIAPRVVAHTFTERRLPTIKRRREESKVTIWMEPRKLHVPPKPS